MPNKVRRHLISCEEITAARFPMAMIDDRLRSAGFDLTQVYHCYDAHPHNAVEFVQYNEEE